MPIDRVEQYIDAHRAVQAIETAIQEERRPDLLAALNQARAERLVAYGRLKGRQLTEAARRLKEIN